MEGYQSIDSSCFLLVVKLGRCARVGTSCSRKASWPPRYSSLLVRDPVLFLPCGEVFWLWWMLALLALLVLVNLQIEKGLLALLLPVVVELICTVGPQG
jgi:hypothetical protein